MTRYDTVSFISDFGHQDEFVGVVHSVLAAIAPQARIVDITHGIAPHDVRAGALALARAAPYLMPGVVLAVVDPGVGTNRRAVALEVGAGASVLVGPDNGLLGPAVALVGGATRAVELANEQYRLPCSPDLGPTFDGRDVFAPAAAHLCAGVSLDDLGPAINPATLTPGVLPVSRQEDNYLVAEVLWIDRYGNCQLNLSADDLDDLALDGVDRPDDLDERNNSGEVNWQRRITQVVVGDDVRTLERSVSYDTVGAGRIGLVIDSTGLVSLAVPRRSAAAELGLQEGSEVRLRFGGPLDTPTSESVITPVMLSHLKRRQPSGGKP